MEIVDFMLYNTSIKIAGNVVTMKSYENTQMYGYNSPKVASFNVKYITEKEKKENFLKSCRRAKMKIFDLIACNVGKHRDYENKHQRVKFLTLTFKEEYKEIEKANGELTKFFKRLSYRVYGTNKNVIKYLAIPELQERGVWHFHIIIFNMKYVPHNELIEIWGKGGVWINALKNTSDGTIVAKYVTKYISKGISVVEGQAETIIQEGKEGDKRLSDYENYKKYGMQNKKRYQCSKGLFKPYQSKIKITNAELGSIYNYLTTYARHTMKDNVKQRAIYYTSYENEYRGQINVLSVELPLRVIKSFKYLINSIYKENRKKFKKKVNVNWLKVMRKVYDIWEENKYDL